MGRGRRAMYCDESLNTRSLPRHNPLLVSTLAERLRRP
jgi:hypothetical protein